MQVLTTIAAVREARRPVAGSVGLVPTMGYLHEGHIALVEAARAADDCLFVSIFVNPSQFGPNEDFHTYPRDVERDLELLGAAGVDYVFLPEAAAIYPPGFETTVDVGAVAEPLEGKFRPGHFRGVATVVLKLLQIVRPDCAYFGQKDAQQVAVVRRLVRDLDLEVEVVALPTVRDAEGLAISSRNVRLLPVEREAAPVLWQALSLAREIWTRGARDAEAYRRRLREVIDAEPLAEIDYISVADPETLAELDRIQGAALVSLAVRIGATRLIDNVVLGAD